MSAITVTDITKSFGPRTILDSLSLDIREGEFVALLGPSGCGKTTLLRQLAGLDVVDAGTIRFGHHVVADSGTGRHVPVYRRNIGMVFQNYSLWPHMSVADNVAYPLRRRLRLSRAARQSRVAEALTLVGLGDKASAAPGQLSGGQQQRVAIARALVADPEILLFDEPLSNLDASLRVQLRNQLRELHRRVPKTTIYVTHDHSEALTLADRVVILNGGTVVQQGEASEVFGNPVNEFAAGFLGYENILPISGTRGSRHAIRLGGAELEIDDPGDAASATAVAFRANRIALGRGEQGFAGVVADVEYLGDHQVLAIESHGGVVHSIQQLRGMPGERLAVGTPVDFSLDTRAVRILRG